ncbi:hypothetical protein HOY80DRAFT_952564 [Tuber brumale]|nr:hypothetical protein HOY80DRAFT_952564 [Tuber brumale]
MHPGCWWSMLACKVGCSVVCLYVFHGAVNHQSDRCFGFTLPSFFLPLIGHLGGADTSGDYYSYTYASFFMPFLFLLF